MWRWLLLSFSALAGTAWGLHSLPDRECNQAADAIQQCEHPENFGYALKTMLESGIAWIGSFGATEWTAVGSVAIVFATIALGVIACVQIATSRAELRAYVFVDQTDLMGLDGTRRIVARSKVTNFGKTPAYKLRSLSELFVVSTPPAEQDFTETKVVAADLGPGQFVAATTTRHALTAEELGALRKREKAIYLMGVITYEDTFGRRQTTKFLLVTKATKKEGLLIEGVMPLCETGNEAT